MKIQDKKESVDKNFTSKSLDLTIGDHAMVMGLIYDKLYADKILVPVQEYLSNARDAMREVKNKADKIQVTLPTEKNPVLKIRDFGPGLSPERMAEVFVQVGKSTKRNSNLQTGGFGIGAKSGFAYTKALVLISYYNGTETHYLLDVAEVKSGRLSVLQEKTTKEKNGVEIQIPVELNEAADDGYDDDNDSDLSRFHRAVYRTICFWGEERPEILNPSDALKSADGYKELQNKIEQGEGQITDHAFIFKGPEYSYRKDYFFVVDGIIYDLDSELDLKGQEKFGDAFGTADEVYILVDNGELEIAANREALVSSKENIQKIEQFFSQTVKAYEKAIKNQISELSTLSEVQDFFKKISIYTGSALNQMQKKVEGFTVDFQTRRFDQKLGLLGYRVHSTRSSYVAVSPAPAEIGAIYVHNDKDLKEASLKTKLKKIALDQAGGPNFQIQITVFPHDFPFKVQIPMIPISSIKNPRLQRGVGLGSGSQALRVEVAKDGTPGSRIEVDSISASTCLIELSSETLRGARYRFGALSETLKAGGLDVEILFPSQKAKKALLEKGFKFYSLEEFFSTLSERLDKKSESRFLKAVRLGLISELRETIDVEVEELLKSQTLLDEKLIAYFENLKISKKDLKDTPQSLGGYVKTEDGGYGDSPKFDFGGPLFCYARKRDCKTEELISGFEHFRDQYLSEDLPTYFDEKQMAYMLNGIYVTKRKK